MDGSANCGKVSQEKVCICYVRKFKVPMTLSFKYKSSLCRCRARAALKWNNYCSELKTKNINNLHYRYILHRFNFRGNVLELTMNQDQVFLLLRLKFWGLPLKTIVSSIVQLGVLAAFICHWRFFFCLLACLFLVFVFLILHFITFFVLVSPNLYVTTNCFIPFFSWITTSCLL